MASGLTDKSLTGISSLTAVHETRRSGGVWLSVLRRLGRVAVIYLVVLSLFGYYAFAGFLAELGPRSAGYQNARLICEIQQWIPLPSEVRLQRMTLPATWLYLGANHYYALAHFPVTLIFVIWVAVARRQEWGPIASSLTVMTFLCLTVDALFPVAPPRLYAPLGVVDTLARFGPDIYGNAAVHSVADEYGAMPSLHFGWSVFVAWGIIHLAPQLGRLRWLAVVHPILTLAAVLLTGNHYWLDCIVAALLVPIGVQLTDFWIRRTSPRLRSRMRRPLMIAAIPLCIFGLYNISGLFI